MVQLAMLVILLNSSCSKTIAIIIVPLDITLIQLRKIVKAVILHVLHALVQITINA